VSATNTSARRVRSRFPSIYYRETSQGRAYEITFRDHTGKQRWERVVGYDNIEAARDLLADRRGKKRRGEQAPVAGVKFSDVASRYLASPEFADLGDWTRKNYRASLEREILPKFGRMKIAEIDRTMVAGFIRELEGRPKRNGTKGSPRRSTVENILKPLRGVFQHAIEEEPPCLSVSPFSSLGKKRRPKKDEKPHEPHKWDDEEVRRLLAASAKRAASHTSRYDYTPLLTLAAKAGLRLGECLGLDWPHCELVKGAGAVHVEQQWTRLKELRPPKAGSRRRVPISDELVRALLELKMAAPDKTGPVFAARTGGRLSHRNVERRGFDPAAEDAGIEDVTFHDLRHAYGSRLASRHLTARQIADAMGHKKTSTTEIYIQRFNGAAADDLVRQASAG
jgi:integrase